MNTLLKTITIAAAAVLCLLGNGCATAEMKGTPFYTGEYSKRRGPAEQRVNGWPLLYYRAPALSVLWPVFELTDDHAAVRPLFSVYGLDESTREYNVLWPLAQFDRRKGESHVFPVFWASNHFVLFPAYWHFGHPWGTNGGTDALFPLWIVKRKDTNELGVWALWPLVHYGNNKKAGVETSMAFPLYWHERNRKGSLLVSPLWIKGEEARGQWRSLVPLFYQSSNEARSVLVTPLWAKGRSGTNDWNAIVPIAYWDHDTILSSLWAHWEKDGRETYLAPWLFSWATRQPERTDLWLAAAMAHASWGEKGSSHYVLPFYYRDATNGTLLTPLCGWSDSGDYFYPLTPLAGVRTGNHSGSWLFPIYSHTRDKTSGDLNDHFLITGGYSKTKSRTHAYFYPVFSFSDYGPLESTPETSRRYAHYGTEFWCLPFCWTKNESRVRPSGNAADAPLVRTYHRTHGVFPLWTYAKQSTPAQDRESVNGSALAWLYDYKYDTHFGRSGNAPRTNDYTRARVCWRLWHYERLNGEVNVDVFPGFTYDRKADGFEKTSFLWRFFRYERDRAGAKRLDLFFVPVKR